MFAELRTKEENFKLDTGAFLAAPVCPATPSSTPQDPIACFTPGLPWQVMNVQPSPKLIYCTYAVTVGPAATPPVPPAGFVMTPPALSWYFILATCNIDGVVGNSTYFTSSLAPAIQAQNEGK